MPYLLQSLTRKCFNYVALLLCLTSTAYSQESGSCAEKLKTAQLLFEKGQVEQVADMIKECMKSGFSREESLSAYKLLIQSYLFEDKLKEADSVMLNFLKINPEYKISPTDHSSFVFLFNNFRVKPIVEISLHFGTNLPFLTLIDPVSLASIPGKSNYSSKALNLFASVEAKFELNKKAEINVEAGYSQISFTNKGDFMGFGITNYSETQNRLEIPVSVTYSFASFGKFTAYGRFGGGPALTLASTATATFNPTDINMTARSGTDIDLSDSRISMDFFTQIEIGRASCRERV
jgi:hypothetical protein